jgi:hypothetical protein
VQPLKNYALQYLHLMIASPRLGKEPKISMLKLDTILKRKERKTYNLKQIEQAHKKRKYFLYLIVGTITAIGIVIMYLLLAKNKREK